MRRAAAVPVAAILASLAVLDGDRAPQRADFPNCQCTVETLDGGLGSSATCAGALACVKVTVAAHTPAQHGLCQAGTFCTADPRPCITQKWRYEIEYLTGCAPFTCCPQDLAEIVVDGSVVGNLARGQSAEIDFGGVEFACATGRFDVLTVRCLNADGSPGAVLIEYDRSFLCQECTP